MTGTQPLDRRHARRGVDADVDDVDVRDRRVTGATLFDDADRHAASAQHARHLVLALFVIADDGYRELRHDYFTSRIAIGKIPSGEGPFLSRIPEIGMMRPKMPLPCVYSRKNPIQLATLRSA